MEKLLNINGALYPVKAREEAVNAVADIIENSTYYKRRCAWLYGTTDDAVLIEYAHYHACDIVDAAVRYGNCRQRDVVITTVNGTIHVDDDGVIQSIDPVR